MNLAAALVASLALASAGGAVIAADLSSSGPDAPVGDLVPPAGSQGCDHCNGTSNQTQDPEQNQTAPPEPEPEPLPAPVAVAEEACEPTVLRDNGTFTLTALGGSGTSAWEFDVDCPSSQVVIDLVLAGWSGLGPYVDFDNRFHIYAGNGTDVAQSHTGLSYAIDGQHTLFQYASEGPVSEGTWLLDLTECLLVGDYQLTISVF